VDVIINNKIKVLVQSFRMGKKKKRHPHKQKGSKHGHRVFTDTARYQRIQKALKKDQPKKLIVNFEGMATALNEYVAKFELGDLGPLRALVRTKLDAESMRDLLIKYERDPSGNGLMDGPIDLYTDDPETFRKSYLTVAIRSFFEYGMHKPYMKRGD